MSDAMKDAVLFAILFTAAVTGIIISAFWYKEAQRLRVDAATAYSAGLTEGARQQALKPCTWQQLFRQGDLK